MSTSRSEPVLSVRDVHLAVVADMHRSFTLREAFTRAAKDPIAFFLSEKDRFHIVNNVSFEVRKGDRVGLIGINGSGKSSLCRCISGLYRQTTGEIDVNGAIRAIFDTSVGILPELTGRENAQLIARFMYPTATDFDAIVEEALEFSELGKFVDIPYRKYSKGMQARLCLSLISSRPCDLLILDEVFDGADVFFSQKISARILRIIKKSGAVIFVSHSASQIRRVCNRLLVMHRGRLMFDGDVEEGLRFYDKIGANAGCGAALADNGP